MRLTRSRYVTFCQQFLVTFTVVALGITAAGVTTLQIVHPDTSGTDVLSAVRTQDSTYVDDRPVTPKVTEVAVKGVDPSARALPETGVSKDADPQDVAVTPGSQADGKSAPDAARKASKQPKRDAGKAPTGSALREAVLTAPQQVHGYATVGITWAHGVRIAEDDLSVQVRTEKEGAWSDWTVVQYHDDHGPDAADTAETAHERPGTDALVVGDVDRVQMRTYTRSGRAPADVKLALIDPGAGTVSKEAPALNSTAPTADGGGVQGSADQGSDDQGGDQRSVEQAAPSAADTVELSAMRTSAKPAIYSRAQWGANESMRDKGSLRYGTIKTGFVHHTVNANNYSAAQVPALIRGIYAYHTQSRGWSDIGYNFLVDRFGRIWEGRYGGVDRAVVGAHTLGYNEVSFAMSAIGNFDIARPPQAVVDAYSRLFAWKLSMYNIPANATRIYVKNRYLQAINGHRDVGQTACPGRYLYAKIPAIRAAARAIQVRAQAGFGQGRRTSGRWRSYARVAAVGDVTGDGRGDVLSLTRGGLARVHPGLGNGHVRPVGRYATRAFARAVLIAAAGDVNHDRRADVVARNRNGRLYLYLGKGHGRFRAPRMMSGGWRGFSALAMPGDLTGDGRPDVVAIRGRTVWLSPGLGGRRLGKRVVLFRLNGTYRDVVGLGDVTGDRVTDVFVRAATGRTRLYPGAGRGRVRGSLGPYANLSGLRSLSAAPMMGSGAADVVGVDSRGRLIVVPSRFGG